MEDERRRIPGSRRVKPEGHRDGLLLEGPERTLRVLLEVELGVAFEQLVVDAKRTDVGKTPQPRLLAPVTRRDEKRPVSVEEPQRPDTLPALLPRRLREVPELHHAARRDGFSQGGEQPRVEPGPRTGTHSKTLGLDQGLKLGPESDARIRTQHGPELRREVPKRANTFLEPSTLESRGSSFELRELVGRDRDEPTNGVRQEAPAVFHFAGIDTLEPTEYLLDRVAHALGGLPEELP